MTIQKDIMIGTNILHYNILEKLGEVILRLSFVGQGGFTLRSIYKIGEIK